MNSDQPLVAEHPPADAGDNHGDDEGEDKAPGFRLHAVDQVHAEHRGDERGNHHDDGHRGERTHDGVHVIVDNRLVGVHGRLEDVRVDAGGLAGLCHLDVDVLDEVGVKLVNLELELQLRQQGLVASDGGLEVGE